MPLLRKKPFIRAKPPPHLKSKDEVFYCELTGEVFVEYEAFYQRMILCNSLVWSCEHSGKANLTLKEALDSEEECLNSLRLFPTELKSAILMLVHHTKRSKIQRLTDEIFDFIKNRFLKNEKVEVKLKDKWSNAIINCPPSECDIAMLKVESEFETNSIKTPEKKNERIRYNSPIGHKEQWPDATKSQYKVTMTSGSKKGSVMTVKGNQIRRSKNFTKDKMKMFLKQTCFRSTIVFDDGYWVVKEEEIKRYDLGETTILPPSPKKKQKKKKKKNSNEEIRDPADFFKQMKKKASKDQGQESKGLTNKSVELSPEERKRIIEEEREKKKLELEILKIQKLKEKEEERARRKDELKKEKEKQNELKKLETDFMREFNKPKEDLKLEDLKPLPNLLPFKCAVNQDFIGDIMMVMEFVNTFGDVFESGTEIDVVTFDWLVEGLLEHDAEGNYFEILKFLLHSYLRIDYNENIDEHKKEREEIENPKENDNENSENNSSKIDDKNQVSSNTKAAAVWPMKYQGMALHEITIEPYSLTEVLRLHILSSGARIGALFQNYNEWTRRGQCQLLDDPCVWFRRQEGEIMAKLCHSSVYDLTIAEKLKLLVLLCNQLLTLGPIRDYMEEALEKLKELRKEHRDLVREENIRKKRVAQEKWKKKVAERLKQKELNKKIKEDAVNGKAQIQEKGASQLNGDFNVSKALSENDEEKTSKTKEELEAERKQKREEKEQKTEEFFQDKFLFNEQQILNEIYKYGAMISQPPLGRDRLFRKYWKVSSMDGILIENDDEGAMLINDLPEMDCEIETDSDLENVNQNMQDNEKKDDIVSEKPIFPKITFEELLMAKESGQPIHQMIFNRYKCKFSDDTYNRIYESDILKHLFIDIEHGIDPSIYSDRDSNKWYNMAKKEQFDAFITSLNRRGIREKELLSSFLDNKEKFNKYFIEPENKKEKTVKVTSKKKSDPNDIDTSLFKTMTDYIEANLRDQLLELEERLFVASIGGIHSTDRNKWRSSIEEGMSNLVQTEPQKEAFMETNENGTQENLTNGHNFNVSKSVPLNMSLEVSSRCTTPELDQNFESNPVVLELAQALLQIENDLESKYLKPPLGVTEKAKKERFIESISEKNKDNEKTSCLLRWEESLLKCTSFSQLFVHLNTFDRSVMWSKSVQNVKCRMCRRKGNEEEMLLCDGCDRGFHMTCLKPALKRVPLGDWFCKDCRPIVIKQRSRKVSIHEGEEEEETEEEDDSEEENSNDDEEDDDEEEGDSDDDDDEDDDEDSEEEESDQEEDSSSESEESEHEELCTVCHSEGTLILCDDCPRSYHIECCYPNIKKVPRGSWKCQICSGADKDLPPRKRAITAEKARNKENGAKKNNSKRKQQRGQSTESKKGVKRKQNSPPEKSSSKKLKMNTGRAELSPLTQKNFGRHQLKQCTTLLNDIFKREEAEVFLNPVDVNDVPDYTDFIDEPMDFGTIKRNLNNGKYNTLESFQDDVYLVFTNCETYNPPRTTVAKNGIKLKTYLKKRMKELDLA